MTQACGATDQVSDIFSASTHPVRYHGVLSDLDKSSCVMLQNGPSSSTGGIGETVMPWTHQAWPKSVHILFSFASPLEHR
jgi:hypothetical protein